VDISSGLKPDYTQWQANGVERIGELGEEQETRGNTLFAFVT
jgi:hypothetical protein